MAGEETTTEGNTDEDVAPEVPVNPVSKPGDVWIMGLHRLLCGDSTDAASYDNLLGNERVAMIFQDPPYNVDYANTAKDKLRGTNRPILNDNLGDGFQDFLLAAFKPALARCNGAVYVAMSSSELDTLQSAFRAAGGKWSTSSSGPRTPSRWGARTTSASTNPSCMAGQRALPATGAVTVTRGMYGISTSRASTTCTRR